MDWMDKNYVIYDDKAVDVWYVGDGRPTMFVAVAGRSNGLGPTVSGNTSYPVINCPPLSADWAAQDIWSSLRLPSGLLHYDIIYYI